MVGERDSMVFDGDFTLAPPTPRFMGRKRSLSNSSMDSNGSITSSSSLVDVSYANRPQSGIDFMMSNELGHEEHILDYTNFDGEDDTRVAGEAHLNNRVRKEGRMRRAKSRKVASAAAAKQELQSRAAERPIPRSLGNSDFGGEDRPPRSIPSPLHPSSLHDASIGPKSGSRPGFPISPSFRISPQDGSQTPYAASDLYRQQSHPDQLDFLTPTDPGARTNRWSVQSLAAPEIPRRASDDNLRSARTPSPTGSRFAVTPTPTGGFNASMQNLVSGVGEPRLEIDDDELEDLNVVAEMARPGKPKLERILADEVERSRGAVAVACEFPSESSFFHSLTSTRQVVDPHR